MARIGKSWTAKPGPTLVELDRAQGVDRSEGVLNLAKLFAADRINKAMRQRAEATRRLIAGQISADRGRARRAAGVTPSGKAAHSRGPRNVIPADGSKPLAGGAPNGYWDAGFPSPLPASRTLTGDAEPAVAQRVRVRRPAAKRGSDGLHYGPPLPRP